jgi:hypothetical protein
MESKTEKWTVMDGPVSGLVHVLFRVSCLISAGWWLHRWMVKRKPRRENDPTFDTWFYGVYVLAWLAVLIVVLFCAPLSGAWGIVFAAVALYRLQDMLLGTIGDAFVYNRIGGAMASKVLLAAFNIFLIVTIFAICFYALLPRDAFTPSAPSGRFGHLFLSWSTLPPLGSGFFPNTTRARSLVMIESAAGVILIVIALSRFLSGPDSPSDQGSADGATAGGGASHSPSSVATTNRSPRVR